MKKVACSVLILFMSTSVLHAQSLHDAVCDYLSKSLYNPSSLIIDAITPVDTLTVGKSLKIRIDETDSDHHRIFCHISLANPVSGEEYSRIVEEREKQLNDEMKQMHIELLKLRDSLSSKLDDIISITYDIKFRADDVKGVPVNYAQVFRVNPEGRITEMADRVGNLRAWIDIIEYNRLRNKLYNEICRWDNYE